MKNDDRIEKTARIIKTKWAMFLGALCLTLSASVPAFCENSARVYNVDHSKFAFVKTNPVASSDPELPDPQPATIVLGDRQTGKTHALFKAGTHVSIPHFGDALIEYIEDVSFDNESKIIYFLIKAWTTSSALMEVDLITNRLRFVCPANSVRVIRSGKWKGNLIVSQHRYRENGEGSYNWRYVVSRTGKELAVYSKTE